MTDEQARQRFEKMKRAYEEKGVSFDKWQYLFFNDSDTGKREHYLQAAIILDEDTRITCSCAINSNHLYLFSIECSKHLTYEDNQIEAALVCAKLKQLWQQAKAVSEQ